jgi:hypothetical protein
LGGLESSVDVLPTILGEISDNELEVQNLHNCALEEGTEIPGHALGLCGSGNECLSKPRAGTSPVEELVHHDSLNLTQVFTEVPEEVSKQAVSTEEDLHFVFTRGNNGMEFPARTLSEKCLRSMSMET